MQENENEVVTAKAEPEPEGEAPSKTSKKGRRALWIVLAVLGLCVAFGVGAVAGGGAVYGLTRARSRVYVRPSVRTFVWPRDSWPEGLPMRPESGMMFLGTGALIVDVVPDSPAEQAGLSEGDVLIALEGKAIGPGSDLAAMIAAYEPGDEVTFEVAEPGPRLLGEGREVTVTLAENPEVAGKTYLGVTFVPMMGNEFGSGGRFFWFPRFDDGDDDDRGGRRFEFYLPRRGR